MKETQTKEGLRFEQLYTDAGIKPAEIARWTDSTPQTVNSWRKRGVPAKFAHFIAEKLKCRPFDICGSQIAENQENEAISVREETGTYAAKNTIEASFLSIFSELSTAQRHMLLGYVHRLKDEAAEHGARDGPAKQQAGSTDAHLPELKTL